MRERRACRGVGAERDRLAERIAALEVQLVTLLARLDADGRPAPGDEAALYARVGLAPGCPDHVFEAAQRSYRRALHPDHRPGDDGGAFRQMEAVFRALRAFRS